MTPMLAASNNPHLLLSDSFCGSLIPQWMVLAQNAAYRCSSRLLELKSSQHSWTGSGGHSSKFTRVAVGRQLQFLTTGPLQKCGSQHHFPQLQGSKTEDKRQAFITQSWKWHANPMLLSLRPILVQCRNESPPCDQQEAKTPGRHLGGCRVRNH